MFLIFFQEGSVGSDLVIKPIPWRLKDKAKVEIDSQPSHDDDEMFLDDDGELSAEVAIDTGLPIKRKESTKHIVYKRKKFADDILGDYGRKFYLKFIAQSEIFFVFIFN